jgi:hypothetical protein
VNPTQDIALKTQTLPDTVEDLNKFILIGREELQACRALLRSIDKVGAAKEIRDAALKKAQNMAEAVLRAEVKMGEILKAMIRHEGGRPAKNCTSGSTVLPEGISRNQSHYAQTLASHPQAIDQAIEQAKKKEEVPTRAAVLRVIKRETNPPKPRESKAKRPKNVPCPELAISSVEFNSAFHKFMIEIVKARDSGWKTTSKDVVLQCLRSLESAVYEKTNKKP